MAGSCVTQSRRFKVLDRERFHVSRTPLVGSMTTVPRPQSCGGLALRATGVHDKGLVLSHPVCTVELTGRNGENTMQNVLIISLIVVLLGALAMAKWVANSLMSEESGIGVYHFAESTRSIDRVEVDIDLIDLDEHFDPTGTRYRDDIVLLTPHPEEDGRYLSLAGSENCNVERHETLDETMIVVPNPHRPGRYLMAAGAENWARATQYGNTTVLVYAQKHPDDTAANAQRRSLRNRYKAAFRDPSTQS